MNARIFAPLFALSSAAIFAAACGGADLSTDQVDDGDDVSAEEALKASVTPGSFKIYSKPGYVPNRYCDLYTKLDLKSDHYSTASLEEGVGGICEIASVPNPRTYRLRLDSTSCGSRIYKGSFRKNGKRSEIKITDNRTRTCRDLVKAKIIVEETKDGATTTKYSYDGHSATNEVWPSDATTLVAQDHGGGFTPPPPAGSSCGFGAAKYTLNVASKKVSWEVCVFIDWNTPMSKKTGTTSLSAAQLDKINKAMDDVEVTHEDICGADKPMLTLSVSSTSQGTKTYKDSFYSCQKDGTYVTNIDGVFTAFREVTGN